MIRPGFIIILVGSLSNVGNIGSRLFSSSRVEMGVSQKERDKAKASLSFTIWLNECGNQFVASCCCLPHWRTLARRGEERRLAVHFIVSWKRDRFNFYLWLYYWDRRRRRRKFSFYIRLLGYSWEDEDVSTRLDSTRLDSSSARLMRYRDCFFWTWSKMSMGFEMIVQRRDRVATSLFLPLFLLRRRHGWHRAIVAFVC